LRSLLLGSLAGLFSRGRPELAGLAVAKAQPFSMGFDPGSENLAPQSSILHCDRLIFAVDGQTESLQPGVKIILRRIEKKQLFDLQHVAIQQPFLAGVFSARRLGGNLEDNLGTLALFPE